MAKPKETTLFEEPEFDEREYIYFEKERAKAIVVVFVIGALLGFLSGYLQILGFWYFSVLIIFVFLLFLRHILSALKIKIPKKFTQKFLVGAEFFLTWLVFWIIFLNPPLNIVSGPQISDLQTYNTQTLQWANVSQSPIGVYHVSTGPHSFRLYTYYKTPISQVSLSYSQAGSTPTTLSTNYNGNYIYFNLSGSYAAQYNLEAYSYSGKLQGHYSFEILFQS